MVKYEDPFKLIINIFEHHHKDIKVSIEFVAELYAKEGAWGITSFPEEYSTYDNILDINKFKCRKEYIKIGIDVGVTVLGAVDVLAHELAHAAVGPNLGHSSEWEAEYDFINNEFNYNSHKYR